VVGKFEKLRKENYNLGKCFKYFKKKVSIYCKMILSVLISYTFFCKLLVAGANGTNGVPVLRQSVVYKQEQESVIIQSQHMVERNAMEPKLS